MTKEQWSETIARICNGGLIASDMKDRYDVDVIKKIGELAYLQVVAQIYKDAITSKDYSEIDSFIKTYGDKPDNRLTVRYDENRNDYYITLPVTIVQLPNCGGVRRICPIKDPTEYFLPIDENDIGIFDSMEIYKILGTPRFYIENEHIRFPKDPKYKEVLLKCLVPLDVLRDDEEVGMPSEHSLDILQTIVKMMTNTEPNSKTVNNQTKQV